MWLRPDIMGPQKGPASEARIKAQNRQIKKQMEQINSDYDDEFCDYCGYQMVEIDRHLYCSKCFRAR